MKNISIIKKLLCIPFVCFISGATFAKNEYSEVFMLEERNKFLDKQYQLDIGLSTVTNHPTLDIQALKTRMNYRYDLRHILGINLRFNYVNENSSTQTLNKRLEIESKELESKYDEYNIGFNYTYLPLIGHVNYLDEKSMSTLLGINMEVFGSLADGSNLNLSFGPILELELVSDKRIQFGINQIYSAGVDEETFTEIGLGMSYDF